MKQVIRESSQLDVADAGMGGMGLPGMGGMGAGGMGGMNMGAAFQMMQQPEYQQAMEQMLQSPGMLDTIAQMNPQLRGVLDNPQARSVHAAAPKSMS